MTILIIDDQESILLVLETMLSRAGYLVLKTQDGREAVQIAQREPVDLIICDYMMPAFSGQDVVAHLKSIAHTAVIPIIILTAVEHKEVDLIQAGAVDYLVKPVKTAELLVRVERVLDDLEATQLRLLKEFTGAVSHEMNQPLSVLKGYLDMAARHPGSDKGVAAHLQQCREALLRLESVVARFQALQKYSTRSYVEDIRILDIHTEK